MKKLRLLFTDKCNRNCEGCCNKDWDLENLPVCESYEGYDKIIITGGEPLSFPIELTALLKKIKNENPTAKTYLYTAHPESLYVMIMAWLDGVTITLHDQHDYNKFVLFMNDAINAALFENEWASKSFKLNIFKGILFGGIPKIFKIKDNVEWIKNCPLPEGEVFMRYENLIK